jgi:hypothetical protein
MSSVPRIARLPQSDGSPSPASFYDLPNELLLNIVSQVTSLSWNPQPGTHVALSCSLQIHTQRALRTLRLLSRPLNEMVKDRVTSRLSLKWELDKVESMLSGPNTFDGSCRSLRIVTYDHSDDHYGWMVLSKLIAKMKGLHAIQCVTPIRSANNIH